MKRLAWISLVLLARIATAQTTVFVGSAVSSGGAPPISDAVNSGENTSGATLVFTINPTASNANVYIATTSYNSGGSSVASIDVKGTAASVIYRYTTGQDRVELWYAKGIASGSGNITITKGDAADECAAAALAVLGANQTTSNGTESHNSSTDAAPTVTVTSASGELCIAIVGYYNKTLTVNGSGETGRILNENGAAQLSISIITKAGAASTVFDDDLSGTASWWMIGVGIKP
jgi:hypothetical protein